MKKALVQFIVSINAIVLIQTAYGNFFSFWQGYGNYDKPDTKVAVGVNNFNYWQGYGNYDKPDIKVAVGVNDFNYWQGYGNYDKPDIKVAVGVNNFNYWQGYGNYDKPDIKVAIAINVDADNQTIQQAVAAGVAQALADYMKKKEGNKKKPTPAILYLP